MDLALKRMIEVGHLVQLITPANLSPVTVTLFYCSDNINQNKAIFDLLIGTEANLS